MYMKKFSSEIELRGHIIDSLILTKVFDGIMDHGGSFEVLDIKIGKKKTDELAVMIDTFKPLHVTEAALGIDDKNYPLSWLN